ncbi:hypothetical protein GCM10009304_06140 [Pseudomonas matsuisoli]|uniref:Uncharacterized protein n=1 Tax=Pseudomonas matsuisoli TaxID=1515666 RepID=A0A917USZ0_9PSED|nr:hypothetical protein GCM10009304_06140 [Pseudomonas matsuisoli]
MTATTLDIAHQAFFAYEAAAVEKQQMLQEMRKAWVFSRLVIRSLVDSDPRSSERLSRQIQQSGSSVWIRFES